MTADAILLQPFVEERHGLGAHGVVFHVAAGAAEGLPGISIGLAESGVDAAEAPGA